MIDGLLRDAYGKRLLRAAYGAGLGVHGLLCLAASGRAGGPRVGPRVFYGGARGGDVGGPLVKVKRLKQGFPEHLWTYNLVYVLSNAPYLPGLAIRLLKRRGIPIVHNQNGVFYPGWYAGDCDAQNRRMARSYLLADHVFYQSEFCRRCAERFLGARSGPGEVLYNALDIGHFSPPDRHGGKDGPFVFLVSGKFDPHLFYRIECTVRGLAVAREEGLDCRLVIAGWVHDSVRERARSLADEVGATVDVVGPYTQEEAPGIYRRADAFVMTKHNDPCPNTVIEAMACGLPVVYVNSGGVPEIVGADAGVADAGVAVESEDNWLEPSVPDAREIGRAMLRVAAGRASMAAAARARAVDRFDLDHWIARHRDVFESLI